MAHWAEVFAKDLRDRAELLRKYGNDAGAKIAEEHALEIEARRAAFDQEEITLDEAVRESGYHREALRKMRREGKWSGRRGDLPRRPPKKRVQRPQLHQAATTSTTGSIAERVLGGHREGREGQPRRRRASR